MSILTISKLESPYFQRVDSTVTATIELSSGVAVSFTWTACAPDREGVSGWNTDVLPNTMIQVLRDFVAVGLKP